MKYYSLKGIKRYNATYSMIISPASYGKTYACLFEAIKNFIKRGEQAAIIRRYQMDIVEKFGQHMFDALVENGVVSLLTGGQWTGVYYRNRRWYLCRTFEGHIVTSETPFMFAFALTDKEPRKRPGVRTIIFDDFTTRDGYILDEFVLFKNIVSAIVQNLDNVHIYMLGNPFSKYCPYFEEMGLTNVDKMKPGDVDVYTYGDNSMVVVQYADHIR